MLGKGVFLSPNLFTVYVDNLILELTKSKLGCWVENLYLGCLMYADDLVLVSASVHNLQIMLKICETEAINLGMEFNARKSNIIRVGSRYKVDIGNVMLNGLNVHVVTSAKYLGLTLLTAKRFKISFNESRMKFFRAANGILSRSLGRLDECSILYMINVKCEPLLIYALEGIELLKSELSGIQSAMNILYFRIFNVKSLDNIAIINDMMRIKFCAADYEARRSRYRADLKRSKCNILNILAKYSDS